jgi:hypothetical protein
MLTAAPHDSDGRTAPARGRAFATKGEEGAGPDRHGAIDQARISMRGWHGTWIGIRTEGRYQRSLPRHLRHSGRIVAHWRHGRERRAQHRAH